MADISRKTIVVLLVLTIIISVIGTWTTLEAMNRVKVVKTPQQRVNSGRVSLTIAKPIENYGQGKVTLSIVKGG